MAFDLGAITSQLKINAQQFMGQIQAARDALAQVPKQKTAQLKAETGQFKTQVRAAATQMELFPEQHTTQLKANAQPFVQQLQRSRQSLQQVTSEVKAFGSQSEAGFRRATASARSTNQAIASFGNESERAFRKAGVGATGLMTKLKLLSATIQGNKKDIKEFGTRLSEAGGGLTTLGAGLTGLITVPIVGFLGGAAAAAGSAESAFAGVQKTVDLLPPEMEKLRQSFKSMSEEMPSSFEELSRVGALAGQLGVEGRENIQKFTGVVSKLSATIEGIDPETAALKIAQFMNVMGEAQGNVDKVGSTIVDLGNKLAIMEGPVINLGQRLAGAGRLAGFTSAQVLGLGAAIAQTGINAEAGGTAMTRILTDVSNAVLNGGKELELFARTAGMSAEQFATAWRTDPQQALVALLGGLHKAGPQMNKLLEAMGLDAQRVGDVMRRLSLEPEKFAKAMDIASGAYKENSALSAEYEKRVATLWSQLKILWNTLKNVAAEFGEGMLPILKDLVALLQVVLRALKPVMSIFKNLPKPIRIIILAMAGLAAAIGPVLVAAGLLLGSIGSFVTALPALTALLTTAGTVGFGGLAAGAAAALGPLAAVIALLGAVAVAAKVGTDKLGEAMVMKAGAKGIGDRASANATTLTMLRKKFKEGTAKEKDVMLLRQLDEGQKTGGRWEKDFEKKYPEQMKALKAKIDKGAAGAKPPGEGKGNEGALPPDIQALLDAIDAGTYDKKKGKKAKVDTAAEKATAEMEHQLALQQEMNGLTDKDLELQIEIANISGDKVKAAELQAQLDLKRHQDEIDAIQQEINARQAIGDQFTAAEAKDKLRNSQEIELLQKKKEELEAETNIVALKGAQNQMDAKALKLAEDKRKAQEKLADAVELQRGAFDIQEQQMIQQGKSREKIEMARLQNEKQILALQMQQAEAGSHEAAVLAQQNQLLDEKIKTLQMADQIQVGADMAAAFAGGFDNMMGTLQDGMKGLADTFTNMGQGLIEANLKPLMQDMQDGLQELFTGLGRQGQFLVGTIMGAGLTALGKIFDHQKDEVESLADDVSSNIESTEKVRGLIAGESQIAIAKLSEDLGRAFRPTNAILLRIEALLRGEKPGKGPYGAEEGEERQVGAQQGMAFEVIASSRR